MNETVATPGNLAELRALLQSESLVLPVGNQTKRPLATDEQAQLVSLRRMSGILEYEPSEFTFTALAGTTIAEVSETLQQRQQYLPFDPMLVEAGATIGGSVGAGLSGPGRFRYGGLRDFLLGVKFLSGDGEVINSGGKVVKNAAGFDIPKLLVGSMGRLGVMVEMTFKVFPLPGRLQTLAVKCASVPDAIKRMAVAAASQWELDAVDYRPGSNTLFLRLAGPDKVNQMVSRKIRERWGTDVTELPESDVFWRAVNELAWPERDRAFAVKIPAHRGVVEALAGWVGQNSRIDLHISAAGTVAWLLCDAQSDLDELDRILSEHQAAGLLVRGESKRLGIGCWPRTEISLALKQAMDPVSKFPHLFHN